MDMSLMPTTLYDCFSVVDGVEELWLQVGCFDSQLEAEVVAHISEKYPTHIKVNEEKDCINHPVGTICLVFVAFTIKVFEVVETQTSSYYFWSVLVKEPKKVFEVNVREHKEVIETEIVPVEVVDEVVTAEVTEDSLEDNVDSDEDSIDSKVPINKLLEETPPAKFQTEYQEVLDQLAERIAYLESRLIQNTQQIVKHALAADTRTQLTKFDKKKLRHVQRQESRQLDHDHPVHRQLKNFDKSKMRRVNSNRGKC